MQEVLAGCALPLGLFRFTIAPLQSLEVPAVNKGNMLRGGFGHAFGRLCCVPQCTDAKACPLGNSCPYKIIFEPSPPPGADRLSKNQDIPRPFVFRPPQTTQARFEKDERFEFGLVLIGRALDFLPYFVLSFRELAAKGLGLNRAKCMLNRVEQTGISPNGDGPGNSEGHLIYSAEDQRLRSPNPTSVVEHLGRRLHQFAPSINGSTPRLLTLRFLTPTFLVADGEVIRRPDFHHVFKRLRDRINSLSTFFGDGPLAADFRGLGIRAEKVRTVSAQTEWVDRYRTSSKTRERHEISGFVGECTYELPPDDSEIRNAELLNWLALGELVHVGKHAAWGNGWFEITRPQSPGSNL
jgi:hypothetical protein